MVRTISAVDTMQIKMSYPFGTYCRPARAGQRTEGGDGLGTESLRPIVKSGGRPSRLTHERRGPPAVSVGRRVLLQTVLRCVGPSANVHFTAIAAAAERDCEGRKEHLRHRPTDVTRPTQGPPAMRLTFRPRHCERGWTVLVRTTGSTDGRDRHVQMTSV